MTKDKFFDYEMCAFYHFPEYEWPYEMKYSWTQELAEDMKSGYGIDMIEQAILEIIGGFVERVSESGQPHKFDITNIGFCFCEV